MKLASIELYELRVPLKKPFTRSKKIGTLVEWLASASALRSALPSKSSAPNFAYSPPLQG